MLYPNQEPSASIPSTTLQTLMEFAGKAYFELSADGKLLQFNEIFINLFGYTEEALYKKHIHGLVDCNDHMFAALIKSMNELGRFVGPVPCLFANGKKQVLTWRAIRQINKDKTVSWHIVTKPASNSNVFQHFTAKASLPLQSKIKYKELMEKSPDAFIAMDSFFRYTYLNKKAGELIGMNPVELIGKVVWDVFPEAVGSDTYNAMLQALEEQRYIINTDYFQPLNLWQENHIYPTEEGLSMFIKDISEKKQREAGQSIYAAIINSSDDAIFSRTIDGIITSWNNGAEELFGYTQEEILGKHMSILVHPSQNEEFGSVIEQLEKGIPVRNYETERLHKNGSIVSASFTISPIAGHNNNIIGYSIVAHNIAERKKAALELQKSERKYRNLFEGNPMPMWVYNPENFSFLDVNHAAIRHYGYSKEEFKQMKVTDIRPSSELEKFIAFNRTKPSGANTIGLWKHQKKDGSIIDVEIFADDLAFEGIAARLILVNDVTEKIRAENIVKKTLKIIQDYRFALDESSIVAFTNQKGAITYVNQNFCNISGYSKEELIGQDHRIVNSSLHSKDFIKNLWTTIANGKVWKGEICNKAKGGKLYWVDTVIVPFLNDEGKPVQYMAIRTDITERKKAEQQITQSENNLRAIFDNTSEGFLLVDMNDCIVAYNSRAKDFSLINTGKEIETGKSVFEVILPERVDAIRHMFKRVKVGETFRYDRLLTQENKEAVWVEFAISPVYENQTINGVCVTAKDITERKNAEQHTRLAKERYDIVAKATSDTIWEWDVASDTVHYNEGIKKMFGYDHSIINNVSEWWKDKIHPDDKNRVFEQLEKAFQERQTILRIEYRFRSADGLYKYVLDRGFVIWGEDDRILKLVGAMQDITELKQRQSEKEKLIQILTDKNENLRKFSFIASHNLRAPVANLMGLLQLTSINGHNGINKEIFDGLSKSTHILEETIQDLVVSLIVANGEKCSVEKLELADVLASTISSIALPEDSDFTISHDFDRAPSVKFNQTYLSNIFRQLISNSIQFRSEKRSLEVHISSSITTDGNTLLTISDNGMGFDSERYKDRLFGLYQRFHLLPGHKGVGLYTVRSQVEALGGSIQIESAIERGTTVCVHFLRYED